MNKYFILGVKTLFWKLRSYEVIARFARQKLRRMWGLLPGCGSLFPSCAFRLQVVHDTPAPMAGLARAPITCQGMVVAVAGLSFNYHIPSIEGGDVREVDVLYRISSGEVFEISAA